jgi:hypothetical protein
MPDPMTQEPELSDAELSDPDRSRAAATGSSPPSPSRRRTIDWRPILLEAFFVVLGVVVALAANEWRQGQADRRSAATALESIREELETNRQSVLRSLQYHLRLSDTLGMIRRQAAASGDSASLPSVRVFSEGFVHPASLLSTAWEAAAATDAVRHMAHDDVLVLAGMYEQQRRYATQSEQIGALIYGEIFARGMGGMIRNYANLSSIIAAFWFRECELLLGYDRALAELRGSAGGVRDVPQRCRPGPRR